jgi:hypothetical protein
MKYLKYALIVLVVVVVAIRLRDQIAKIPGVNILTGQAKVA